MKIGSLVICINDKNLKNPLVKPIFEKKIYTIRGFFEDHGVIGILIEEIKNPPHFDGDEIGYNIKRFRELDTPTKISIENLIQEPFLI